MHILEIESKKNGSVELKFATRESCAWWNGSKNSRKDDEAGVTCRSGLKSSYLDIVGTERTGLDAVADQSVTRRRRRPHNDPDHRQHSAKRIRSD